MNQGAVEIIDVTKEFGKTVAVQHINLNVGHAEFFSFLGPSGCGKTTLLRMIAGFERPSSGQILIGDKDVVNVPAHKRPVNMVFQSYALFPHLTVFDNVCFGLRSRGRHSRAELQAKAKKALDLVRLPHLSDRFPSQLSGGQQQRIALARAIVNEPAVLLLDEPLSALDPQIREEMQVELTRLQRALNMTFVMVTHDQSEALALSDRIAVFCSGNLEQIGTPKEVHDKPKTKFVAQFVGQSNLIPSELEGRQNNSMIVRLAGGQKVLVDDGANGPVQSGRYELCIKPEAIEISAPDREDPDQPNTLTGKVLTRTYKGSSHEYVVDIGGQEHLRVEDMNDDGIEFDVGSKVTVKLFANACSLIGPIETPTL